MLTVSTDYFSKYVKEALKLGFDVFMAGDDVAYKNGLMINPGTFQEALQTFSRKDI